MGIGQWLVSLSTGVPKVVMDDDGNSSSCTSDSSKFLLE